MNKPQVGTEEVFPMLQKTSLIYYRKNKSWLEMKTEEIKNTEGLELIRSGIKAETDLN